MNQDDDFLRTVFTHFQLVDRLRFEIVSKRWQAVIFANHSHLYVVELIDETCLEPKSDGGIPSHIVRVDELTQRLNFVLSRCSAHLSAITLSGWSPRWFVGLTIDADLILMLINQLPTLRLFKASCANITPEAIELISRLVDLECIMFENCEFVPFVDDEDEECAGDEYQIAYGNALASTFGQLAKLERLYLKFDQLRAISLFAAKLSPKLRNFHVHLGESASRDLATLHAFIDGHRALVEFWLDAPEWEDADPVKRKKIDVESPIRCLTRDCPSLRVLGYNDFGSHPDDDVAALHDLEQIWLYGDDAAPMDDDALIDVCRRNPTLKQFEFLPLTISRRAFVEGFATLHSLEVLELGSCVEPLVDDDAFQAVCEANALSLRRVQIQHSPALTAHSLTVLGHVCARLEKVNIFAHGADSKLVEPADIRAFVECVLFESRYPKRRIELTVSNSSPGDEVSRIGYLREMRTFGNVVVTYRAGSSCFDFPSSGQ